MPSLYELASQAIAKIETVKTPRIFRFVQTVKDALVAIFNSLTEDGHRTLHADILSWDDLQCPPEAFNAQGSPSPPTIDNTTVPGTWLFSGTTENNLAVIRQMPITVDLEDGTGTKNFVIYNRRTGRPMNGNPTMSYDMMARNIMSLFFDTAAKSGVV